MIADIDARISRQMDAIIHAPQFQQLESFWRSMKAPVERVDFRENIKVNILHVTKEELLDDFEFAPEITQSGFYKHVYSSGFGQFGGEPIAAVLGAYEFKKYHARHETAELCQRRRRYGPCAVPFFHIAGIYGTQFMD